MKLTNLTAEFFTSTAAKSYLLIAMRKEIRSRNANGCLPEPRTNFLVKRAMQV